MKLPGTKVIRLRPRRTGAAGREIVLGRSDETFPRHSEGDIARLPDGTLLAVWSRFVGASDHAPSEIVGRRSADGGRSWSEIEVVASLSEPEHRANTNLMSASLLWLERERKLMLVYLSKEGRVAAKGIRCYAFCRFSTDGRTFTNAVRITDREHYYVVNNARVIRLRNGRLLMPAAVDLTAGQFSWRHQSCLCFISDDAGATWKRGRGCTLTAGDVRRLDVFRSASADELERRSTLQEPGLIERKDGSVLMVIRTLLGHPYRSVSRDRGLTWSKPEPIRELVSPASPQTLFRLPKSRQIGLIYNANPKGAAAGWTERTPLSFAVSADEGRTFRLVKPIEEVAGRCWAYVSCRVFDNNVYLLYYEWPQGHEGFYFCDFKLSVIPLRWFEQRRKTTS